MEARLSLTRSGAVYLTSVIFKTCTKQLDFRKKCSGKLVNKGNTTIVKRE